MGIANVINVTGSAGGGEIIRELSNSSDGQGLHFDGASGTYVNCGDSTILDGATKISLEAIAATSGTSMGTFISKSSSADCINLRFNADGKIFCALNNGSSTVSATTSGAYNDGNLRHIVATWDNATISIYVNGNLDGTATLAGGSIPNTADRLALGANVNSGGTTSNNFNGSLYRARFYNSALTQTEVDTAYQRADVPFADQYGSETELSTNSYTNSGFAGFSGSAAGFTASGSASGNNAWKNQSFTAGKKYRMAFTVTDGESSNLEIAFRSSTGGSGSNTGTIVSSTKGNISGNFLQFTETGAYEVILSDLGSAQSIRIYAGGDVGAIDISGFSIVAIGCVTDYDLAFANPSQSLMVQDRAGVADGTASAGISQTQKIVQLNAEELRVAGSTPKIGVGLANTVTPAGKLHVHGADGDGYLRLSTDTTGATATDGARIGYNASDLRVQNYENSKIQFFTNNTTEALTIDSAGVLGVGNPAPNGAMEISRGGSGTESIISTWSTTDAEHSQLSLKKSSSATINTKAVTASGESLGAINAYGVDTNTDQRRAARIEFNQAAAATGSKVAGNMVFKTSSTSANDVTAMTIDSAGVVTVGSGHTATLNIDAPTHDGSQASQAILNFKYAHSGAPSPVGYIKLEENAVNSFDGTLKFGVPYNNGSGGSATREAMTISSAGAVVINKNATVGRLTASNDVNYRAASISEINSSISFRVTKTRLDETKAIAIGCLGSSNSDTGLQCYDTSDDSANTFKIQPFGGSVEFGGGITLSGGITTLGSFTELTIASGAVTVTSSVHRVDTESNAGTDDLDTINGGTDGSILILSCADNGRDVVFKDNTGNLKLNGDFTATNKADTITLVHYGSEWREVSRSDNA